jgi:hypothetical protein
MNEQNLDVNLIIQSFQEKLSQVMTELVVKDATIKQLTLQLQQTQEGIFQVPETTKKDK